MTREVAIDVAVVGGGMAGLTAAHVLSTAGFHVAVFEQDTEVGGRVQTRVIDDTPVDVGAQFVSSFYGTTLRLLQEINISSALIRRSQRAYLLKDGVEQALWPLGSLMKGGAISPIDKVRLACLGLCLARHWRNLDIANLSKSRHLDRQSTQDFLERRIGRRNLRNFVSPLLRGLLYWDADTTSISIVLSTLKAFATSKGTFRFRHGIHALAKALAVNVDVHCGTLVNEVIPHDPFRYTVKATVGGVEREFDARSVVCAGTTPSTLRVLPWLSEEMSGLLRSVTYSQTALCIFRMPADWEYYPHGAILFPVPDVPDLSSINPLYQVVDSTNLQRSAPCRLLTVSLSDKGYKKYGHLDDYLLAAAVQERVVEQFGARWPVDASLAHVQRWDCALPRFDVGHTRRMDTLLQLEPTLRGVVFAGDYIGGSYLDGAVRSGSRAAQELANRLPARDRVGGNDQTAFAPK